MRVKICLATLLACVAACCGGSPTAPGASATGASQASGSRSLTGTVFRNQDVVPVSGASMSLSAGSASTSTVTTDASGGFVFPSVPVGVLNFTLTAPGYVTRASILQLTGASSGLRLDMIEDAAPFSMDFYRQFARNAFDAPATLQPLKPWTMAPSFYINTQTIDTGEAVDPAAVQAIETMFVNSVPELTAGKFSVATIETGVTARASKTGWVNVQFLRNHTLGDEVAGNSTVGGNVGTINLVFDPPGGPTGGCEAAVVYYADHEIVHSMGYYHTANTDVDFHSAYGCLGSGRPAAVLYHAAVVYSRSPGNTDPDTDTTVAFVSRFSQLPGPVVVCPRSERR